MEQSFQRDLTSLAELFAFLDRCFDAYEVDPPSRFAVNVAVEEFFTNMVKYNRKSRNEIAVQVSRNADALLVGLTDPDSEPFDVTSLPTVDTSLPLGQRSVGGLGIHLAKQLVDTIRYEHTDGRSTITLTKNLEKSSREDIGTR